LRNFKITKEPFKA